MMQAFRPLSFSRLLSLSLRSSTTTSHLLRTFSISTSSTSPIPPISQNPILLIVGSGPGIGSATAKLFASKGYTIALCRRTSNDTLIQFINSQYPNAKVIDFAGTDARSEDDVISMVKTIEQDHGAVEIAIYNIGANIRFPLVSTTSRKFEKCWELGMKSGFLVAREVAKAMIPRKRGSLFFTGASASTRGAANFSAFGVTKAGLRSLAQSAARELGPQGIHVSHVIVAPWCRETFKELIKTMPEGGIIDPDDVGEAYLYLHNQKKTAFTFELDLRPFCEKY